MANKNKSNSRVVKVGLIGMGTVGTGVANILIMKARDLKRRTGIDFVLKTVCVKNRAKKRSVSLAKTRVTSDPQVILRDPEIDQVVELIGGIHPARAFIVEALRNGKDVISANKALFAENGAPLFDLAQKLGRHIGLEASVAGGIPIVKSLREGLASNSVSAIFGILNGTCNFILTEMSAEKRTFADALNEAKKKGFVEKNPALDLSGLDTAHKLAILSRIAFQKEIDFKRIICEGIQGLSPVDVAYVQELGYSIKLLAIAKRHADSIELRVHPTLLERGHLLANVNGVYNAVLVRGDEVDDVLFYGKGAGQRPTASAVLSDMIDIAKLRSSGSEPVKTRFGPVRLREQKDLECRYYLRFQVKDRPGILGKLTTLLGNKGISISTVHQMEFPGARDVPVIMLTHLVREKDLRAATSRIDRSRFVRQNTIVIRIED